MRIISTKTTSKEEIIDETCKVLAAGGMFVFPTETSYGIGVDATNPIAVEKLFKYKRKREGKALSIIVTDQNMAKDWVEINDTASNIYKNFLPGPLTVISKGLHKTAPGVESENGTQGIRIPDYELVLDIAKKYGRPFTATSANASGKKTPYKIEDIFENISQKQKDLIDLVLDAGELAHNPPSTIIDTVLNEYQVLRQGAIEFKNEKIFKSKSVEDTINFAKSLLNKLKDQIEDKTFVFALQGELGAGKTQFTKGLAEELGIQDNVVSPTFTISREYPYELGKLIHIDVYRIEEEKELLDLDFMSYIKPGNIISIEWVDKVVNTLQEIKRKNPKSLKIIWVKIDYLGENLRLITYDMEDVNE